MNIKLIVVSLFLLSLTWGVNGSNKNLKVALVQMDSFFNNIETNLKKIALATSAASSKGAKMILFPELSLTGYKLDELEIKSAADTVPGELSSKVLKLAEQNNILIMTGLIEKYNDKYYITQIVCYPTGEVKKYRKSQLGKREKLVYSSGTSLPVFDYEYNKNSNVKFGIAICYDNHFPSMHSVYSQKGADLIFAPFANGSSAEVLIQIWGKFMGTRAYDNTTYILAVNHYYNTEEEIIGGGTAIWGPSSKLLSKCESQNFNILYYDINMDELKLQRTKGSRLFYTENTKNELYGMEYSYLAGLKNKN